MKPHRPSTSTRPLATALLLCLWLPGVAGADKGNLSKILGEIVEREPLSTARTGVLVARLDDGKVLYAHNAEDLLNPASNVKLFTSAAALHYLGPAYRFDTEFFVDGGLRPQVKGNLYVRGKGDPSITTERLASIAGELYHLGIRSISGDIVIDDSYFDGEREGPGYDQEHSDRAYASPTGAVSLSSNVVAVHVYPGERVGGPGRVELEPPSEFFALENRTVTARLHARRRVIVASIPAGEKQRLAVAGRLPADREGSVFWKKIDNPAAYFGQTLKAFLAQRGVKVKGKVRRGEVNAQAERVYIAESDTLDLILKRLNKNSSNFIAEQLVKTLGAEVQGGPGSWEKGIAAIASFLEKEVGIPQGSYIMKNGSGLNDTNRFSPSQVVKLLTYMYRRFPLLPEYLSSLGIASLDGTVRFRMEASEASGRIRAKTGTLENVSALSGYCQTVGGERLAFSILVNDFPSDLGAVLAEMDAVGSAVAAWGVPGPGSVASALPALRRETPAVLAQGSGSDDLKARSAFYVELGRKSDKRNLAFLRTSLLHEKDSVLRAVLGEAIYLSDRDSSDSVRAMLENYRPSQEAYERVTALGRDLSLPSLVLSSIVDVAAEGSYVAISRLIGTAPFVKKGDPLAPELADSLAEVARNAPDELIQSLRTSSEPSVGATLDLLALGLVRAAEPDHPFPLAVRAAQGSIDAELASFARSLDAGLSTRIAAEKAPKIEAPNLATDKQAVPPARTEVRPGGG